MTDSATAHAAIDGMQATIDAQDAMITQDRATITDLTEQLAASEAALAACEGQLHPPAPPTLRAVVTLGGADFLYDSAAGTDLGDYAGPGFTQRCLRVTRADCPLVVHLRPDRDSTRREVVFELSTLTAPGVTPTDLGGYTATIMEAGATLATVSVPKHFWYSRWRWQSAPRPVTAAAADLAASGKLPRYADTGIKVFTKPKQGLVYTPMGLAGVEPGMPNTGERDDIGPVTEQQGYWLVTGQGLDSVMAQAEAAATLPMYRRLRDAPLSFDLDPTAQWIGNITGATRWFPNSGKTGIILDCAHFPALTYLPFLLTGDPYHLEALQCEATHNIGQSNPANAEGYRQGAKCLFRQDQTRSYAWTLRSVMQLAAVTPATVPAWLLPKAYWASKLQSNLDHYKATWISGADPVRQLFKVGPRSSTAGAPYDPWQADFVTFIAAWAVRLGHTGWQAVVDWTAEALRARVSLSSGWPRSYPSVYNQAYLGLTSWAASWAATQAAYALPDPPADGSFSPSTSWGYAAYTRGVLALLGGGPEYDWLHGELKRVQRGSYWKWQITP